MTGGIALLLGFSGCWKKSGEAVVLAKEYIAAKEVTPTPAAEARATATATPENSTEREEYARFEVSENEIVVEGHLMKKEDRGTGRDPRALQDHEQWRVTVQLVEGGRQFNVQAKRPQWEKLKVGDRVKVSYREGKYTGTIWSAEIKK